MTIPENIEQQQMLIADYLYGELSASERSEFESALESNANLKTLFEQEQRFDSLLPIGTQPSIDDERLDGNRWLLRQNLQKQSRTGLSLKNILQGFAERPLTVAFQGVAMAMTFALGIMVATPSMTTPLNSEPALVADIDQSPLRLVSDDDFEIYKLKVNSYDAVTGDIDLSFSLASETRLSGNVADQNIHQLMAVALQDDIDSASRLDTINALQPVASGDKVFDALIYVLANDQNPGVRYQAVQSLVSLSHEARVQDALRLALQEDVNQGVRVEAFNALTQYRDDQTLSVFRQQMDSDSNEYIRAQARTIVEEVDANSISL